MRKTLIVVDMLIGFCKPDHPLYCGPPSEEMIPGIRHHIETHYNPTSSPVLFLADSHEPDDPEFEMFPPHCIRGTEEAEVVPELRGIAQNETLIPKNRYSGFFRTNLDDLLQTHAPDLVEVCGVCTNICVLYTVEELRNRFYRTRVLSDLVTSFDPDAHQHALVQMRDVLGAELT